LASSGDALGDKIAPLSGVRLGFAVGVDGTAVSLGVPVSAALGEGEPTETTGSRIEHPAANAKKSTPTSAKNARQIGWIRCFMRLPPLVPSEYTLLV
jgi:hypothetical protein